MGRLSAPRSESPQYFQRARTFQRRISRAKRSIVCTTLRFAERISPRLAALLLFQVARRPPRRELDAAAHAALGQAMQFTVQLDDCTIRAYAWGEGPVALCIHGWGGRAAQMLPFVEPLNETGFRVVTFDAPAHGASGGRVSDPIAFARAIGAVAAAVGPVRAVIAHSLGAAAALLATREGGLRPGRMVLLGGYAHFDLVLHKLKALFAVSRPVLENAFQRWFGQYGGPSGAERLSPLEALRLLECPTFILHDHDDEIVPVSHAEQLFAAAKSGALVRTRGLGHHSILNGEVARWCAEFLIKQDVASAA